MARVNIQFSTSLTAPTYSEAEASGPSKFIQVAQDENNGGEAGLYFWTGSKLLRLATEIAAEPTPEGPILTTWEVLPPSGFDMPYNFKIFWRSDGVFFTNLNPDSYKVAAAATYYLSPTGNDSNDGQTVGTPKQSLINLVSTLNAAPPTGATIYLAAGEYDYSIGGRSLNFAFPVNLICPSGKAKITTRDTGAVWAPHASLANCYQYTKTADKPRGGAVVDFKFKDEFAIAKRLKQVANTTVVSSTPGSVYSATGAAVLRLEDSRTPDEDVHVYLEEWCIKQTAHVSMYFENVDFFGGRSCVDITFSPSSVKTIFFHNCDFGYGFNDNALSVTGNPNMKVFCYNSRAHYGFLDGFNYHGTPHVVEIDCEAYYNGQSASDTASNGTTTHDGTKSIRINGNYQKNDDRNVHDVGAGTLSWLLRCKAGFARNGSTDPYISGNFSFGIKGTPMNTKVWMDSCESLGGSGSDYAVYEGSTIFHAHSIGANTVDSALGSYQAYERTTASIIT